MATPEVALLHEGDQHVHDRPGAQLGGHVRDVIWRRDFNDLHAADALASDHPQRLERLAR